MNEEKKNKDVWDAWILNEFQLLNDKISDNFTIDNFWIAHNFCRLGIILLFITNILSGIALNLLAVFIILTIGLLISFSLMFLGRSIVTAIFFRHYYINKGMLKNPLRKSFSIARLVIFVLLIFTILSFFIKGEKNLMFIMESIEITSFYLYLIFASLEYKKPTGKSVKDRAKDLLELSDKSVLAPT
jgi:hypothetical protein